MPPLPDEPLTLHASAEPTRKRRGEAAEAAFLARATHLGFTVLIPWGDSNRYDSVVELNHGLLRVQVKSATLYAETRYRVKTTGASGKVYTSKEIDFFVAYIVPENIWYIIPSRPSASAKAFASIPTPAANPAPPSRNTAKPGASSTPAPKSASAKPCQPAAAAKI
jgi:hypothetical protein